MIFLESAYSIDLIRHISLNLIGLIRLYCTRFSDIATILFLANKALILPLKTVMIVVL